MPTHTTPLHRQLLGAVVGTIIAVTLYGVYQQVMPLAATLFASDESTENEMDDASPAGNNDMYRLIGEKVRAIEARDIATRD